MFQQKIDELRSQMTEIDYMEVLMSLIQQFFRF